MSYMSLMPGTFNLGVDANQSLFGLPEVNGMGALAPQSFGLPAVSGAQPGMFDGMFDNFLSKPGAQGWGGLALGAASGLMNGVLGFQQMGIAKDTLNQNKKQFNLNFDAQRKMTNSRLADRQATRIASNPNAGYASPADYMKQYGI